jgi:VanZ family protein
MKALKVKAPRSNHRRHALGWALKVVFLICLLIVITALLLPASILDGKSSPVPWDKANHFIAFYGLTLIAIAAFPSEKLRYVSLRMACLGFATEAVQPLVGRETSLADGMANTLGILAVTIPIALSRWRTAMKNCPSKT